jgi:protoheme ferro-lyase
VFPDGSESRREIQASAEHFLDLSAHSVPEAAAGTPFPCFTSTKVQIASAEHFLDLSAHSVPEAAAGTPFPCFTSTKVQIASAEHFLDLSAHSVPEAVAGSPFPCFTSTKVQILTQKLALVTAILMYNSIITHQLSTILICNRILIY